MAEIEFVKDDYRSVENRHFLNNENGKQLLFEWVRRFGFNYEQASSMYDAMRNEKSGVVFYNDNGQQTTDNSLIASVQKDIIEIFKNRFDDDEFQIFRFSDFQIQIDSQIPRFSVLNKDENFKLIKDASVAQFDIDKITFPLKLRHWRKGDKFKPLGMKGSKLLSDFFNDLGFTAYQKRNVWIMEDAKGLILWVVGYRISDKVKILDTTTVIFQCDIMS